MASLDDKLKTSAPRPQKHAAPQEVQVSAILTFGYSPVQPQHREKETSRALFGSQWG